MGTSHALDPYVLQDASGGGERRAGLVVVFSTGWAGIFPTMQGRPSVAKTLEARVPTTALYASSCQPPSGVGIIGGNPNQVCRSSVPCGTSRRHRRGAASHQGPARSSSRCSATIRPLHECSRLAIVVLVVEKCEQEGAGCRPVCRRVCPPPHTACCWCRQCRCCLDEVPALHCLSRLSVICQVVGLAAATSTVIRVVYTHTLTSAREVRAIASRQHVADVDGVRISQCPLELSICPPACQPLCGGQRGSSPVRLVVNYGASYKCIARHAEHSVSRMTYFQPLRNNHTTATTAKVQRFWGPMVWLAIWKLDQPLVVTPPHTFSTLAAARTTVVVVASRCSPGKVCGRGSRLDDQQKPHTPKSWSSFLPRCAPHHKTTSVGDSRPPRGHPRVLCGRAKCARLLCPPLPSTDTHHATSCFSCCCRRRLRRGRGRWRCRGSHQWTSTRRD